MAYIDLALWIAERMFLSLFRQATKTESLHDEGSVGPTASAVGIGDCLSWPSETQQWVRNATKVGVGQDDDESTKEEVPNEKEQKAQGQESEEIEKGIEICFSQQHAKHILHAVGFFGTVIRSQHDSLW